MLVVGVLACIIVLPGLIALVFSVVRYIKYPEKSFYHSFLNVVLSPVRFFRLGPFKQGSITLEKAMKYAVKKTGLSDFGESHFIEAYKGLVDLDTHKRLPLTNIGYIGYRIEMNMSMVRRLKTIDYLKRNPDVLKVPVRSPVFVLGLPRTGTTFLHRMLSLDPAIRSPLLWELLAFVPSVNGKAPQEEMQRDNDSRAQYVRKLIKMRKDMGDRAIDHIHETDADEPEECIWAMTDELPLHMSALYTIYVDFDNFVSKCTMEHCARAYKYYKSVLQLLSYQAGERGVVNGGTEPRRWMLKSPMHMFFVPAIAKAFPDAKLVWTHRHPLSAVPSMCSLIKSLHQMYFENESRDDALIGRQLSKVSANVLQTTPKEISDSKLPCADVTYENLIKDPIGTVKAIYKQFGWDFTSEYEQILVEYLRENKKKRELKKKEQSTDRMHLYTPEEFSLTSQELCEDKFKEYIDRYQVPISRG